MTNAQNLDKRLKEEILKYRRKISKSGLEKLGFTVSPLTAQLCGLAESLLLYLQNGVVVGMDKMTGERTLCMLPRTW